MSVIKPSWKDRMLLRNVIMKKEKELKALGYLSVSEEAIWEYLLHYQWKDSSNKKVTDKKQDILAITPNQFFDYQRLKAQTQDVIQFDWNEIEDLL